MVGPTSEPPVPATSESPTAWHEKPARQCYNAADMHEVSLIHALFDQVDRAIAPHPCSAVRQVSVRIGALAGVDVALFRTAFAGCRDERGYGAAALHLSVEPAVFQCEACGTPVASGDDLRCSTCDGDVRLTAGGEIILSRLELEVRDV